MTSHTLLEQAESMTHRGVNAVQAGAVQLRSKAQDAGDVTVRYIQTDPIKAVLIAAATGAALMALVGLVSRARTH